MSSDKNQNQILETFISMKKDAEYNETTPASVFYRCHEDAEILTKMTPNSNQNGFEININRRIKKDSRTDMESATFF